MKARLYIGILCAGFGSDLSAAVSFPDLSQSYQKTIRPLVKQYCLKCHSTKKEEGELDMERIGTLSEVRKNPKIWQKVREMMGNGEMPPEKKPQLSAKEAQVFAQWLDAYLDAEARANAGDPGYVVLRRLSNAEYTYTIQDLTGVPLNPAKEFPVDGAAGEGFMNVGDAMAMSPALAQKYLDAAKEVAQHAVLTPEGIRFSLGKSPRDWTDELLFQIRSIYSLHTVGQAPTANVYRWDQAVLNKAMQLDGRIKLESYISALLRHRDRLMKDPGAANQVARDEKLNAKYLRTLAELLTAKNPSLLLREVRERWRTAKPQDAAQLAGDIRNWQNRLWRFDAVGHIGRPGGPTAWMNPVTPVVNRQELRLKLPKDAKGEGEVKVYLAVGDAGDGSANDVVLWEQPRLMIEGYPAIGLSNIDTLLQRMKGLMDAELSRTTNYLAVIAEADMAGKAIEEVAKGRDLNAKLLEKWAAAMQLGRSAKLVVKGHYTKRMSNVGGYADIRGWGEPATPNLFANKSGEVIKFGTLTLPGRSVTMHPSPTKEAIIYWQSPMNGKIRLKGLVADSDGVCGNGAAWRVEIITRLSSDTVAKGVFDNGKQQAFGPDTVYTLQKGDLIKVVVNARDKSHGCDTTQIELIITEQAGKKRVWDLARDVADRVQESNPLPDSFGNAQTWHFCATNESAPAKNVIPDGSTLAAWRAGVLDKMPQAELEKRAQAVQRVLLDKKSVAGDPDKALHEAFGGARGPLGWLRLAAAGRANGNIEAKAPSVMEFRLPAGLAAGAEVAVSGLLHPQKGKAGSVQFQLSSVRTELKGLIAGQPIVTSEASAGRSRVQGAFDDFRELFPAAMCHAQIVPVDEVVTMILFHREDEPLARLMLNDAEAARLDRLWKELLFVGEEPIKKQLAHEQIYEFATQDRQDLANAFAPMRGPIGKRAEAFREYQRKTEPIHLAAVLEFAGRTWRRPLTDADQKELRGLYEKLRAQEISHDRAIRLTLARVLTSPAFLFRLEQPAPGKKAAPVSDLELANRLSYFLNSTMPDAQLRNLAESGKLSDDKVFIAQTRRLLRSEHTRRLATEFACQWFGIHGFDQNDEKNEKLYPQFARLRVEMYEESVRFLEDLFRNDGSVLNLLNANYTFTNESLAAHYGIEGVKGSGWRRTTGVRAQGRGGILGMASVLAKQSGASRTSPILRGNWVSETLLGERLPKPPAKVPELPDVVPDGLTARQLIEKHSTEPSCAKCHKQIDPYGFALEQYDAIGRLRSDPVDTRTKLADGKTIDGMGGLRDYILKDRHDDFLRQFCRKLLGYALGREVQLSDELLLAQMQRQLKANGYRFSVAVEAIVTSRQFRQIRGVEAVNRN